MLLWHTGVVDRQKPEWCRLRSRNSQRQGTVFQWACRGIYLPWPALWSWVRKTGFYSVKGLNLGLWRGNRTEEREWKCHPGTRAWDGWAQEGRVWLGIPASAFCIVILEFCLQLPKTTLPRVLVEGRDRSQAFLTARPPLSLSTETDKSLRSMTKSSV